MLIAENEDDLQRLLYGFVNTASTFNMQVSIEKTQLMIISKEPIRCKLEMNNKIIQQVMKFNYLGVITSSDRDLIGEVHIQANRANRIAGYLRDIVWRNQHISIKSKVRIYKTCIRPVLTYAAEARADTAKTKRILRMAEMKTLRAIRGINLKDRMESEQIRQDCEIQDIVRWTRARWRCWKDHVDRMAPKRLAKWVKTHNPQGHRPPGRPPKRWYESCTSGSQEV